MLLSAIAVAMAARRYATTPPRQRRADEVHGRARRASCCARRSLQLVAIAVSVGVARHARRLRRAVRARLAAARPDAGRRCRRRRCRRRLARPRHGASSCWSGSRCRRCCSLKRVPPARVLRRNLEPPPLRYAVVYGLAVGAVLALLYWLVRDARLVGLRRAAASPRRSLLLAARRLAAGAGAGAAARRRRRRLALRAREHRAPRPRQRRADRRLRPRLHGAAAARAGAQRPAARLAARACPRARRTTS